MDMDLPPELEEQIARLNRRLADQRTLPAKLEAIAEVLERTVRNCDAVSVSLQVDEATVTGATSNQVALEVDLVQYKFNEGPCLTAAAQGIVVRIDLLAEDERYEHFAPGAIELGVRSVLSIPLRVGAAVVGTCNLYSYDAEAFPPELEHELEPITSYAAELIAHSLVYAESIDLIEGLVTVSREREVVAMCIGFLQASRSVSDREAWDVLRKEAATRGLSLFHAAQEILGEAGR